MPPKDVEEVVLYSFREFLGSNSLDSFRAYLSESFFGDEGDDPGNRMVEAGFFLSEEWGGHFSFDHASDMEDLPRLLAASTRIIDGLTGLNAAIRALQARRAANDSEGRNVE